MLLTTSPPWSDTIRLIVSSCTFSTTFSQRPLSSSENLVESTMSVKTKVFVTRFVIRWLARSASSRAPRRSNADWAVPSSEIAPSSSPFAR